MILTKEQIEARVTSNGNIAVSAEKLREQPEVVIKDGKNHEGRPGTTNLTEQERVAVGVLANTVGEETAATLFGIEVSTAHKLKFGMQSGDSGDSHGKNMELANQIKQRLESSKLSIQERAAEKLLSAMGLITEEKMANSSVKELASVSSQLSQVVRNMTANNKEGDSKGGVKIYLHQPKEAKEDSFDIIEIGAT